MAVIMNCSIDLSKIDQKKIVEHKNGGKYYNFSVILNNEKDKYGNDVAITDSQTEKQRKAKEKKVYIGNGKKVWDSQEQQTNTATGATSSNNHPDFPL